MTGLSLCTLQVEIVHEHEHPVVVSHDQRHSVGESVGAAASVAVAMKTHIHLHAHHARMPRGSLRAL